MCVGVFIFGKQTRNARSLSFVVMNVELIRWPAEADKREQLHQSDLPRLLLVAETAEPPVSADLLEDWIRIPSTEADLDARLAGLRNRIAGQSTLIPTVDEDGVVRLGAKWAALPPLEARLCRVLVDRFQAVASREALGAAGWPDGADRNALDVHMLRLRRRIEPLGLTISTVRSRGYLLEVP